MPPFRDGLKRKTDADRDIKEICSAVENVEFGSGVVDEQEGDGSEEEPDPEEDDQLLDEVVFESDVDSTLGEEGQPSDSDNSSVLSDSQDEDSDDDDSEEESEDSGAAVTDDDQSGVSDNASDKPKHVAKSKEIVAHNTKSDKTEAKSKSKRVIRTSETPGKVSEENKQLVVDTHSAGDTQTDTEKVREYGAEDPDTSDEEGAVNRAGAVPQWWYREYPHVGYDLQGRRVLRPAGSDLLDTFLRRAEDPDFWRTVTDPHTQQEVVLSEEDLQLLRTLKEGRAPGQLDDQYPRWEDWFTRDVLQTPVRAFPDHKRSFLPSKTEQKQISRLVHALNMGWIKTRKELAQERKQNKERRFYDLWGSAGGPPESGAPRSVRAPRRPLPGHGDSYRPPPEYLPAPGDPLPPWAPRCLDSLRTLPAYPRYIRDRFLRCLDLYLAPRAIKMKVQVSAEELVPSLPSPRDLQPFPSSESVVYRGHSGAVRSCSVSPCGQYCVSGGEDGEVRVWEVGSGRCLRAVCPGTGGTGGPVVRVMWAPSGLCLVAALTGDRVVLINPGGHVGDHHRAEQTDLLLRDPPPQHDIQPDARVSSACRWEEVDSGGWSRGVRVSIRHVRDVTHADWHIKGDYIAVVTHEPAARALVVHQISRRRSQLPLSRHRGLIQCVSFHPVRPFLFVATQRNVRVYDLMKRELVKKLTTGAQYISSMAVHPGGDNLLVGSFDRKSVWFDLDLSSAPYQCLKVVGGAVRSVAHHRRYPLWAAGGDGGHVAVCHGRVYQDLTQCPLLVPLRRLAVPRRGDLAALDLVFHPTQPWLLVALADHTLRLYT